MAGKYVPRERKHRRLAKTKSHTHSTNNNNDDSNLPTIQPESQSERSARRTKLALELREQQAPETKISSKKRKRLDKYVDIKLRKEENLELLKKLAVGKVDTSLMQSSKQLGRVVETKRERFGRALRERAAGLEGEGEGVLFQRRREAEVVESEGSSDLEEDGSVDVVRGGLQSTGAAVMAFGSGLKRPLEMDESGQPVIKKRKRTKKSKISAPAIVYHASEGASEGMSETLSDGEASGPGDDEWNGFDDSPEIFQPKDSISAASSISEDLTDASSACSDSELGGDDFSEHDSDSDSASSVPLDDRKTKISAFKQWADSQRNVQLDFTPSTIPTNNTALHASFKPRQPSPDLDQLAAIPTQQNTTERTSRPSAAISIPRTEEVQKARLELPVVQEEQKIMEAIHSNPIVIVCGATGSGKTTQVPQMLFESGYGSHIGRKDATGGSAGGSGAGNGVDSAARPEPGPQSRGMIAVTQPRRVAALSVAERVSHEVGPEYKGRVAHQVRYDSSVGRGTAIKFMTDGILLREISQDFILSKYSVVVIDEAHERSVNTDILIGMLSRIVPLRQQLAEEEPKIHYPLKLVIMSATLRVADFANNTRLFPAGKVPPIVEAEGRQYPVTVHFSRRTDRDFVGETVEKVARGHRKLPGGGMLVFLTSQQDVLDVGRRLRERLGGGFAGGKRTDVDDFDEEGGEPRRKNDYLEGEEEGSEDDGEDVDITGLDPADAGDDNEFQVADSDQAHYGARAAGGALKPHILPLYAALPSAQQMRVFRPPPAGSRLIVLATNVAETSLTIPGIRYVFDCGRAKEKRYDPSTGVQTFEVDWISKASAAQRSGRAGRTGPGHCYRLYSSAVYERYFAEHALSEILRTPLESTVLQLKSMEIEKVVNFPFPTAPNAVQLAQAERLLRTLGAIEGENDGGKITQMGKEILNFPVSPRYGKMLIFAQRNGVLPHTIAIVAGLAVGDLFIPEAQVAGSSEAENSILSPSADDSDNEYENGRARRQAESAAHSAGQARHQAYTRAQATLSHLDGESDAIKLLTAVAAYADISGKDKAMGSATKFCEDYFLREKGMGEVQMLRGQLSNIVRRAHNGDGVVEKLEPPTDQQRGVLKQIVAAGFLDQVAVRADILTDNTVAAGRKPKRAIEVAYRTLTPSADVDKTLSSQEQELQRSVYVHPSSVLSKNSVKEMPAYIVYSHLSRAAPATIDSAKLPRTRFHPLTAIRAAQLAKLAEGTPLLEFGKPVGKIEDLGPGKRGCWVTVSLRAMGGGGGEGWPLGAWKVEQRRGRKGEWENETVVAR